MNVISITRTIDEMGRILLPIEVRNALEIDEKGLLLKVDGKHHSISIRKAGRNKENGSMIRPVDESGRIHLPAAVRKKWDWRSGTKIGLQVEGESGVLQEWAATCVICGMNQTLLHVKNVLVCEDCINTGNEAIVGKWSDILGHLVKKYKNYCDNALSFKDTEDVHKARTKGRRLRTLIHFVGVDKEHELYERLKKAHDALGAVREDDVLIKAFEKEAVTNEYGDVYRQLANEARKKRNKHREKLKKQLPELINDDFLAFWKTFEQKEIRGYILPLDIIAQLQKYEQDYNSRVQNYDNVIKEKGKMSDDGLDALHAVRKKAKKLRYIYSYLDKMYSGDFKTRSKQYKKVQKKFGDIIDLRDWLEEATKRKKKSDAKEKDVKKVIKQMEDRLKKLVDQVEI
ncbi:CHAD domain-containing protein [Bacillus sp. AK031]